MKRSMEEKRDLQVLKDLKKNIYDKGWKIYKTRQDKSLPNNNEVTKKIEQSIKDDINEKWMIEKTNRLLERIRDPRLFYQ